MKHIIRCLIGGLLLCSIQSHASHSDVIFSFHRPETTFIPKDEIRVSGSIDTKTIHAPRRPWQFGAYGVEFSTVWDSGWKLDMDIAASPVAFVGGRREFVTSGKAIKYLSEDFYFCGIVQLSGDARQIGGAFRYVSSRQMVIDGEMYLSQIGEQKLSGGFLIANYKLSETIVPHIQIDYQYFGDGRQGTLVTTGVALKVFRQRVTINLDHEWHSDDPRKSTVVGVARWTFK